VGRKPKSPAVSGHIPSGSGERGDVASGGHRGRGVSHHRPLLAGSYRWRTASAAAAEAGVAVVARGAGGDFAGLAAGWTLTAIAADLSRSTSTVSREVTRNSGVNGYRAAQAERLAVARTARPRPGRLAADPVLRGCVDDKLRRDWSRAARR
jgi:hypothetical protein